MSPSERPPGIAAATFDHDLSGLSSMVPRHLAFDAGIEKREDQISLVFDEDGRLLDGAEARRYLSNKADMATRTFLAASAASTNLPSSPRTSEASASSLPADAEVLEETPFARSLSSPPTTSVGIVSEAPARKRPLSTAPRLAMLVNGSDGDVRPMLALAIHMTECHGHNVHMFTNVNMVDLCVRHGIAATAVFSDSQEVLERAGGLSTCASALEAMRKPFKEAKLWVKEHPGFCAAPDKVLTEFDPHAIILGTQALATAMVFEEKHKVPVIPVYLSRPYLDIDCMRQVAESEPHRPSFFAHSKFIREAPQGPLSIKRLLHTGAWLLDEGEPSEADLAPSGRLGDLQAFLRRGPPPVCFGWGSMVADSRLKPEFVIRLALGSLKEIGRRGVILGGWMRLHDQAQQVLHRWSLGDDRFYRELAAFAAEEVCFIAEAPHGWLLPQCCCLVHHGGVGTVHAALRTGIPSVVTPVCADQHDFASRVTALNVGCGLEALSKLTLLPLVRGLKQALGESVARSVANLSFSMQREELHALPQAGSSIDTFVRKTVIAGHWARSYPAASGKPKLASPQLGPTLPNAVSPPLGPKPHPELPAMQPLQVERAAKDKAEPGAKAKSALLAQNKKTAAAQKKTANHWLLVPGTALDRENTKRAPDESGSPAGIEAVTTIQLGQQGKVYMEEPPKTEIDAMLKFEEWEVQLPSLARQSSASSAGGTSTAGSAPAGAQETDDPAVADGTSQAAERSILKIQREPQAPPAELSLKKAFAMQMELWAGYSSADFQAKLLSCEQRTGSIVPDRSRLSFEVQRVVLPKYGFEPSPRGIKHMMQAIKQHYTDKEFLTRTILINNILELGPSDVTPPREAVPVFQKVPDSLRRSAGFSRLVRVRLEWSPDKEEVYMPACANTTLKEFIWFLSHTYGGNEDELRTCGFSELADDGTEMFALHLEDRLPDFVGIEVEEWPFVPVSTRPELFLSMTRLRELHEAILEAITDGSVARKAQAFKETLKDNYQLTKSRLARQAIMRVIPRFGFVAEAAGVRLTTAAFYVHMWHPEVVNWLEQFERATTTAVPWRPVQGNSQGEWSMPQAQQVRRHGA